MCLSAWNLAPEHTHGLNAQLILLDAGNEFTVAWHELPLPPEAAELPNRFARRSWNIFSSQADPPYRHEIHSVDPDKSVPVAEEDWEF